MRFSCNACRVLRKGCSPDCPIRPCLHWIKSSLSQSNATVFLAKFYGRAGLLNLLTAAAPPLRPAVFKSLLYEACGRIVNPVSGSTGLFSTGSWHLCEAAVEAVLSGAPIQNVTSEKACDPRHVAKGGRSCGPDRLHEVKSRRRQFKRRGAKPKAKANVDSANSELDGWVSRESGSSVSEKHRSVSGESDSGSVESVEAEPVALGEDDGELQLELELTLGWGSVKIPMNVSGDDTCRD